MEKLPILVIAKGQGRVKRIITGIVRAMDLPLPQVGDVVRVVIEAKHQEYCGSVSMVDEVNHKYDLEIDLESVVDGKNGNTCSLVSRGRGVRAEGTRYAQV